MAVLGRPRYRLVWLAALGAAVAALVSALMIITLPSGGSIAAGWRHELTCSLLAAFAIYAGTWTQGRSWPQPAAVYATVALLLEAAAIALPVPRSLTLPALAATIALAGCVVLVVEWTASRGHSGILRLTVAAGMVDLVAITPMFALLVATGTLR